jgi:hypothetical protein
MILKRWIKDQELALADVIFLWPVVLLKDFGDYPGILPEIK